MTTIPGAELVTSIFGSWPRFHDAEVLRFALLRTDDYAAGPAVEADVRVFETTDEVAPNRQFVLRHQSVVSFRFEGVQQIHLTDFNNQNVLWELAILELREHQLEGPRYEVRFASSFGMGAHFLCRSAAVTAVRPWRDPVASPAV